MHRCQDRQRQTRGRRGASSLEMPVLRGIWSPCIPSSRAGNADEARPRARPRLQRPAIHGRCRAGFTGSIRADFYGSGRATVSDPPLSVSDQRLAPTRGRHRHDTQPPLTTTIWFSRDGSRRRPARRRSDLTVKVRTDAAGRPTYIFRSVPPQTPKLAARPLSRATSSSSRPTTTSAWSRACS